MKKRITYRITATLASEIEPVDKAYAQKLMEQALSRWPFDQSDPFIQVMQVDDTGDQS